MYHIGDLLFLLQVVEENLTVVLSKDLTSSIATMNTGTHGGHIFSLCLAGCIGLN
jgi:hypothetical protein